MKRADWTREKRGIKRMARLSSQSSSSSSYIAQQVSAAVQWNEIRSKRIWFSKIREWNDKLTVRFNNKIDFVRRYLIVGRKMSNWLICFNDNNRNRESQTELSFTYPSIGRILTPGKYYKIYVHGLDFYDYIVSI